MFVFHLSSVLASRFGSPFVPSEAAMTASVSGLAVKTASLEFPVVPFLVSTLVLLDACAEVVSVLLCELTASASLSVTVHPLGSVLELEIFCP